MWENKDFSFALVKVRHLRCRMSRTGWNGASQYVVYQPGYPEGIAINRNTANATGMPEGTVCSFRPYLMLKTVDDSFVPWVPSISDILADDWVVEHLGE